MSDSEELIEDLPDAGDDLFGDGGDDNLDDVLSGSDHGGRALSDADLASDDENRRNDYDDEMRDDEEPTHREEKIMNVVLNRHPIPKSTDGQGQLKSFKVPPFLRFMPEEYKPDSFTPTEWDLKNAQSEHPLPVIRYRRDPATGKMQSNTNIYRWSDGSVTMAVGDEHYELTTKSLAPRPGKPYNEVQDAHYYAAAAHMHSNCLVVVGHLAEQYAVRPNHAVQDDALEGFRRRMEEATKSKGDALIIQTHEDPELAKKKAELAEKERNKAQRKRETAAAKMEGAGSRYARGALSIGDLEGGRRGAGAAAAGGRKRGAAGGPQSRKRNRNAEYDSDDDLPGGSGRHDEYILDDFAVASDEEGSEGEEDDEEEILDDDEEEEEEAPRRKRQRTADKDDADADAEADMEDDAPAPSSRRRRRVVDDDEDDD